MFRRKLIWQLYPSFLATTLLALPATTYSSYTLRTFYLDQLKEELRLVGDVAASQVVSVLQTGTAADVDALCKKLGRAGDGQMRLTVIASDGRVLGDSDENPALMEDHSNRAEIVDAMGKGLGRSIRFSPTLGRNMMYVAVPVGEAGPMGVVVRTAIPVTEPSALRRIYIAIVWAGAIVAVCAALRSLPISRRSRPDHPHDASPNCRAGTARYLRPDTGAAELMSWQRERDGHAASGPIHHHPAANEVKAILSSLGGRPGRGLPGSASSV